MKFLQDNKIFMSYDIPESKDNTIDRFENKDLNFSVSWMPSLKDYYQLYLKNRLEKLQEITGGKSVSDPEVQKAAAKQMQMKNPCFVFAHEIFDALPIHQFRLNEARRWCERVVNLDETG